MSNKLKKFLDPNLEGEAAPAGVGLRKVKGVGVLPRSRAAGASKYDIASLEVGDAWVSEDQRDIRNVSVAARAFSKRAARNGGVAPKFVTRKISGEYTTSNGTKIPDGSFALVRES